MEYIIKDCLHYSEGVYPPQRSEHIDYVRLCFVLLLHFHKYSVGVRRIGESTLLLSRNNSEYVVGAMSQAAFDHFDWRKLWRGIASAITYYADNQAWTWMGPEERRIREDKIPVACVKPEETLSIDRSLAKKCITVIAAIGSATEGDAGNVSDELLTSLCRFIPPS